MGSVWCPSLSFSESIVGDDFCAERAEGSLIEIEGTVELCMGQEPRVDA